MVPVRNCGVRYLEVTRDDETSFLTTGHVEPELLFRRQSEEVASKTSHIRHKIGINAVINHLENAPILACLDDLTADLFSFSTDIVDAGERYHRDFVAKHIVGDLGAFIFVTDEFRVELRLSGELSESSWSHFIFKKNKLKSERERGNEIYKEQRVVAEN